MAKTTATITEAAFHKALDNYYAANAAYNFKKAALDREIQKLRDKHEGGMEDDLAARLGAETTIRSYAAEHRDDLFGDKKSGTFRGVSIAFRTSPPSLVLASDADWEGVKAALARSKKWQCYLVHTVEVNKSAILRDRPAGIEKLGLEIEQKETLSISVKS